MNNEILEIPPMTKQELVEKQKECFNDILRVIENEHYNEIEKLYLISYFSKIALDDSIIFRSFRIK